MFIMKWWNKIGHEHRFDIYEKENYGEYIIFKFQCIDCGNLKTKIVSTDKPFEIDMV